MLVVTQPLVMWHILKSGCEYMCPKAPADNVIIHRIEFQEREREMLDMLTASLAIKNVSSGVGSLIAPVLGASLVGVGAWIAVMAYIENMISKSLTPEGHVGWSAVKGGYNPVNADDISHGGKEWTWDDIPEYQNLVPTEQAKISVLGMLSSLRISLTNMTYDLS